VGISAPGYRVKWRKESENLAISDAGYKVAKFKVEWDTAYRASFRGQFIGQVKDGPQEARQVCENHWQITGQFEKLEIESRGEGDEG
jgi:hypothetical protein